MSSLQDQLDEYDIQICTRQEILALFDVKDGVISTKGSFYDAPIFTPFYYSFIPGPQQWEVEYLTCSTLTPVIAFYIESAHITEFPELIEKDIGSYVLIYMGLGKIYSHVVSVHELIELLELYGIARIVESKKEKKEKKKKDKKDKRKCNG